MKDGCRLLRALLRVSEKAANIARICRHNESLFSLLVQEKSEAEKNPRFFQDFKTLADVLIQETIKHDIAIEFPEVAKKVKGEENNVFSNTLGETITVEVLPTWEETTQLLVKVLDQNTQVAELLSKEVHKDIFLTDVPVKACDIPSDFDVPIDDVAIWIDPIDSTADYINGRNETPDDATKLSSSGLPCVTVLIGAYQMSTNAPVIGVINQPFHSKRETGWKGKCYWGCVSDHYPGQSSIIIPPEEEESPSSVILLSRSENPELKSRLAEEGFDLVEATGAGYKMLSVVLSNADAYLLSKDTTFRWDVCAPHAILRALGGGILIFQSFLDEVNVNNRKSITYSYIETEFSNKGGILAYRKPETLERLKKAFSP